MTRPSDHRRPEILLTPEAMARVDAATSSSGIDSFGLMLRAGEAVAAAALRHFPGALRFVILCGPGNNGGDGYVAASALARAGADVRVHSLVETAALKGDAARAQAACPLPVMAIEQFHPDAGEVIIDALFGAGLRRELPAAVQALIRTIQEAGLPVLAVDLPSGIDGATGEIRGEAFEASHTVTFMTRKPGHVLLPGRLHCGSLEVFDIGIPRRIVQAEARPLWINGPAIWAPHVRYGSAHDHKYRRGHVTVFSGPQTATGAGRLSAEAALRAGAGLVTLASPSEALATNAAHLTAVMLSAVDGVDALSEWLADTRRTTFVLGPGFGDRQRARAFAEMIGQAGRKLVLDADGITAFAGAAKRLNARFGSDEPRLVVTPHEGEFSRLFPEIAADRSLGKVEKALAAADALGGIVVYKGADTVIAAPDGRAGIEEEAPATLATAGSGDVLAGIIGARLANGMPAFEAACAAVYQHGQAALRAGRTLTAEDLITQIQAD
ncbi:yjeF C-terminal region, hydroxyethylthiazole kinase-related/yjeF N-terminal region [Rhizobium sp. RU33A]|uniref:NAD(P)H-hydrate dehydratase n=1 Tax=Rhizobium sp. RU33A TaxID=1907413 RepID=UPI000954DCF4|nr:NAD(P)H-hydrate dehydratase [Rhizobium sp. RU33A]SIR12455.1 yjeF C-terminal region, hydroxyethylthiazole kinase-related/yjeF N-terminal region [Rhizobium sp. RU33A]